MTLRQLQGKKTKEKIYSTAITLFNQLGYRNVTVDLICQTSQIAKGTFYVHFKTKEDIIKLLYKEKIQTYLNEKMDEYAAEHSASGSLDALYFYCISSLQFSKENDIELTSLSYITHLNSVLETKSNWYSHDLEYIKTLVGHCKQAQEIKDEFTVDYITSSIIKMINGAVIDWCLSNGDYDIVKENQTLFHDMIFIYFARVQQ